jgi:endonuclease/exonuclease/phosphatase (EEP) superfamily protein YafD
MKRVLFFICLGLAWLYTSLMAAWFWLRLWFGDQLWWLALISAFAPFLFVPMPGFVALAYAWRRRMLWLATLLPLVLFLWLYGSYFLPALPLSPATPTFTVMSFNIWGGSRLPETARIILENGSPDVVALQELRPRMAELLLQEVGHLYPYQLISTSGRGNGNGILSRYPLKEIPLPADLLGFHGEIRLVEIEVDEQTITLYNVHPRSTNVLALLRQRRILSSFVNLTFDLRTQQFKKVMTHVRNHSGPVLVVGDFNSTEQSDVYALLSQHLTDAHQAVGWGFGHTFPAYQGRFRNIPIYPRLVRLDMIFYSEHFWAVRSWVGKTGGESDHLPIFAQLTWNE